MLRSRKSRVADGKFNVRDAFRECDTSAEFLDRGMREGLADEQEMPARRLHRLTYGLTGEQVVTQIDRLERRVAGAVRGQPAACGDAFAILLVMAVLRGDELRDQRHDAVMAGRHDGRRQQGVMIFGRAAGVLTRRASRAAELGRALILRV